MQCLYCGKELALLKKLRGGGEFCSEAHRQTYQEEFNRLALSRLLQAQTKSEDGRPRRLALGAPLQESRALPAPEPPSEVSFIFEQPLPAARTSVACAVEAAPFRAGNLVVPAFSCAADVHRSTAEALDRVTSAIENVRGSLRSTRIAREISFEWKELPASPAPPYEGVNAPASFDVQPRFEQTLRFEIWEPPLELLEEMEEESGASLSVDQGLATLSHAFGAPVETRPASRVPRMADELLEISFALPVLPGRQCVVMAVPAPLREGKPVLPRLRELPLRPKMYIGPAPAPLTKSAPAASVQPPADPEPLKGMPAPASPTRQNASKTVTKAMAKAQAAPEAQTPAPPKKGETKPKPAVQKQNAPAAEAKAQEPARVQPEPKPFGLATLEGARTAHSGWLDKFGVSARAAAAVALVAVLVGGGYYLASGTKKSAAPLVVSAASEEAGPSIIVGEGGWKTDWSGKGPKGRQISIYQPSMSLSNYRFEFRGQIDTQSLGWVFRAQNPQNYYAMKLEVSKNGPHRTLALVRYAVIEGLESDRTVTQLPIDARYDSVYQVRLDARGPEFAAFVNGKPAAAWTDTRIRSGGAGFLNEPGEAGRIQSVSISILKG